MIELLTEFLHNLAFLFGAVISGLGRVGVISFSFIRDTFRAHFNLIGQYTAPLEQELLDKEPPKPSSLNIIGQIVLTLFPLTILSWLISLTIVPLIYNSGLLSIVGFMRVTNLALLDLSKEEQLSVPKGSMSWYRVIYGLPGFILGGSVGLISAGFIGLVRIIINSFESIWHSFASVTNFSLEQEDKIQRFSLEKDDRPVLKKYILGFPGIIVGGLAGGLGIIAVYAGRVLVNSYKTTKSLTVSGINVARHENEQIEAALEHDERSNFFKYGLGFPGLFLGSVTAGVGLALSALQRSIVQSWKTAKYLFVRIVRQAWLPGRDGVKERESLLIANESIRLTSTIDYYFFGAPGFVLGSLAGSLGFVAVILGRVISNSFITARSLTISGMNLIRHDNEQIKAGLKHDKRSVFLKYILGFPGLIIGSGGAILGIAIGSVERFSKESWKTTKEIFSVFVKQALPADEEQEDFHSENTEPRSFIDRYVFGGSGLFFGFISGGFAYLGIIAKHSTNHSIVSAKHIFATIINPVLDSEDQFKSYGLDKDSRPAKEKYGLGLPGIIAGSIGGSLGVVVISASKVVFHSWHSALHSFATLTNLALAKEDKIRRYGLDKDERLTYQRYGLGLPGLLFGGLIGPLGFATVGLGRVLANSYKTIKSLTVSAINLARHNNEQIEAALEDDKRGNFLKYGLGFPGLILGPFIAGIGLGLSILRRTAVESWKTSKETYALIIRPEPVEESDEFEQELLPVQRSFIDRYLFGAAGFIGGVGFGGLVYVGRGLSRLFKESFDTGSRMFTTIANLGLTENERFQTQQLEQNDPRSWQLKYLLGLPGAGIGAVFGTIFLSAIGIAKLTTHSFNSWRSLSGSILNGSLELPLFGGLAADKRSNIGKVTGILGYAFALLTTLPVGIIIFTFKKVIPVALGLLLGILSSPIVAGLKAINQSVKQPRFADERSADEKEQRFRNIYSSLTEWGQLAENSRISEDQNGRKGPSAFTRKAFTFNISTITEYTLDQLLKGYRESTDQEAFFEEGGEFSVIIDEVKEHYKEFSYLEPHHYTAMRDEQIDNIGTFVKNYVLGKQNTVPQNMYEDPKNNWTATFWGVDKAAASSRLGYIDGQVEQGLGSRLAL